MRLQLRAVVAATALALGASGAFAAGKTLIYCSEGSPAGFDPARYTAMIDSLINYDRFLVCADFDSYWAAQMRVEHLWHDKDAWWRTSVLNTARMGWFSSDRNIREYATEIWKAL